MSKEQEVKSIEILDNYSRIEEFLPSDLKEENVWDICKPKLKYCSNPRKEFFVSITTSDIKDNNTDLSVFLLECPYVG
jgi:hypothetical protein